MRRYKLVDLFFLPLQMPHCCRWVQLSAGEIVWWALSTFLCEECDSPRERGSLKHRPRSAADHLPARVTIVKYPRRVRLAWRIIVQNRPLRRCILDEPAEAQRSFAGAHGLQGS